LPIPAWSLFLPSLPSWPLSLPTPAWILTAGAGYKFRVLLLQPQII
jgi:hypothetical protein